MKITGHNEKDLCLSGWHRSQFLLLSSLPGRKRWVERNLIFEATGANLQFITDHWPDAEWEGEAFTHLEKWKTLQVNGEEVARLKKSGERLPDPYNYVYKTEPFGHQHRAFILSRELEAYAFLFEQGCGKSKPTLDTAAFLYETPRAIDCLIVIAPNGVHRNWVDNEVPAHLPDRIHRVTGVYSSDLTPKQLEELERSILAAKGKALAVLTFNVEAFGNKKHTKARDMIIRVAEQLRCMIVVDESSRIANWDAERTKFLVKKVAPLARFRRILTGTPIRKGAENLFAQFMFLNPLILGFTSFTTYRARYCVMGGFEGRVIVGYQNLDELIRKVDQHSFRVLKRDCLDLPPKTYKRVLFEMSPEASRVYRELKGQMMTKYQGEELTTRLSIVQMLRLQQIASGWWPSEEGGRVRRIDDADPRMDALREFIRECDESEQQAIIWSRFTDDIDSICKELGPRCVRYDGKVSNDDRAKAVRDFQKGESKQYFIAQLQAAATGLTLTAASSACYFNNSFDLEARLQSEDRCHRIGTKNPVTYVDLEARLPRGMKTVDHKVISSLVKKKSIADLINQDPRFPFLED